VGELSKISTETQHIRLIFTILKEIEVPLDVISVDELQKHIGKRVGILHIDGDFFIREI